MLLACHSMGVGGYIERDAQGGVGSPSLLLKKKYICD